MVPKRLLGVAGTLCIGWARMQRVHGSLAVLVLAAPLFADMPAAALLQIRLVTPVSSYSSKPGDTVRAVVVAPLHTDGVVAVPPGSVVRGTVKSVRRVGLGLVRESATLELDFNGLEFPGGRERAFGSRVIAVDNAREHVDTRGRIHGTRATASISHRLWYRVAGVALSHPFGVGVLLLAENALLRFPDPEIDYSAGTEMRLAIEGPLPVEGAVQSVPAPALKNAAELDSLVTAMPYWSYSKRRSRPMDMTNLLFVGLSDAIETAFTAAGWSGSRTMSPGSGFDVFRAIAENRGYPDAPMRTLLVRGAEPDMSWQKGLNDFTKRHHLRIWKQPESWDGQPVWLSAATWDIAAGFSFRLGLTHEIETDLDVERDKVVDDLLLTGCVDSVALVPRPEPAESAAGIWRTVQTDGALAAVFLNSCNAPGGGAQIAAAQPRGPGTLFRFMRRLTLTTRNHFLRDNVFWKSGEAGLLGIRAVRSWRQRRATEAAFRHDLLVRRAGAQMQGKTLPDQRIPAGGRLQAGVNGIETLVGGL